MAELRTQNNTYAASLKAAERKIENLEARLEQREEELNEARDKLANTMETVLDLKDDMKQMKDKKEAVENQIEVGAKHAGFPLRPRPNIDTRALFVIERLYMIAYTSIAHDRKRKRS